MYSDNLILTDVDGVLLDYMEGYEPDTWVQNITDEDHWRRVKWVNPFDDAKEYLPKIHDLGFEFHAITAVGAHPQLVEWRMNNLKEIWGYRPFAEITCVPSSKNKREILSRYNGSGLIWIEDYVPSANLGLEYGLDARLRTWKHNRNYDFKGKRLNSFKELYEELTA